MLFPGSPGENSLDASVPAELPVGVPVQYFCTDPNFMLFGPTSNMCNDQGMYGPAPECVQFGK